MGTIETSIQIRGLSFGYTKSAVLEDVSMDLVRNKLTVIMGQNGSGKSTLLRIIAGILPYRYGSILVGKKELKDFSPAARARVIAFLPQQHKPVFPFSVEEVVLTGRAAHIRYLPGKNDYLAAGAAIEKTGILHLKDRIYTELSGGEQQLAMITRTLAQEPEILLLDEPVSHLDYNNQLRIIRLLKKLVKEGITVISIFHDPNMAFLYGDHFVFVHNRQAVTETLQEPWNHPLVREIFHEDMVTLPYGDRCIILPGTK